jgi:hypothetical protein
MKTGKKQPVKETPDVHSHQSHQHGESCSQKTVKHGDRVDYVHDGRTHRIHDKSIAEREQESRDADAEAESAAEQ